MPLPEPGALVGGKYRIERALGEGGMGVVFCATHLKLNQQVAIKILKPDLANVEEVVTRFEREARAASQLEHKHTVRVLDVDAHEGVPYMVMELLRGHDLEEELKKSGPLPPQLAVDYVLQACSAMREVHARGIVHRDLKPSNLFLAENGEGGVLVKLLDFGISKIQGEQSADVTGTKMIGTPFYMSPEQVRSAKGVDARTDVWSLGVILFELLTGRVPWDGGGNSAFAMVSICKDPLPDILALRPEVPANVAHILSRALKKDRDRRVQSVAELASLLAGDHSVRVVVHTASAPADTDEAAWNFPTTAADPTSLPPKPSSPPPRPRAPSHSHSGMVAPASLLSNPLLPWLVVMFVTTVLLGLIGGVAYWIKSKPASALAPSVSAPTPAPPPAPAPSVSVAPVPSASAPPALTRKPAAPAQAPSNVLLRRY